MCTNLIEIENPNFGTPCNQQDPPRAGTLSGAYWPFRAFLYSRTLLELHPHPALPPKSV